MATATVTLELAPRDLYLICSALQLYHLVSPTLGPKPVIDGRCKGFQRSLILDGGDCRMQSLHARDLRRQICVD